MRSREEIVSTQRETWNEKPETVLVGREAELEQLQRCWARVLDGTRQVVFVSGEPGIGKTSLVDVFLSGVRRRNEFGVRGHEKFGVQDPPSQHPNSELSSPPNSELSPTLGPLIAHGQCVEQYGAGEAYLPLLEATTRLCRGPDREQCIAAMKQYAPSWLLQLPGLLTPEEQTLLEQRVQELSRERMLREMAETAEQFSAQRALVVVLEDLHWSDVATLDWLTYLARRREPARLLILGTYRPGDVLASNHPLRGVVQELQGRHSCEEIRLAPLGKAAIALYLARRFDELTVPDTLATALEQRTGGNPLFLVNTVDHLVQQQIVTNETGQWTIRADKVQEVNAGIPDTLRQLIEYQVERLSEDDMHMLEVASVVGMEFSVAEVAAGLAGDVEVLETQCERLARAGQFLRADRVDEWPDGTLSGRYGFVHAVYQEVISARIGGVRRIQLHRRIAERKEAAYGQRAAEVAAELAVHFEQGREYAKAVQYHEKAAHHAMRRNASHEAIAHLTKGLSLLAQLPESTERAQQELALHVALGPAMIAAKGNAAPEVEHIYARARELCRHVGESPQLFRTLLGLRSYYLVRGEIQTAHALSEELATLARHLHDQELLLEASMAVGNTSFLLGNLPASRAQHEQAVQLYDLQKHREHRTLYGLDPAAFCLSRTGWTLWLLGYADQAEERLRDALQLAEELAHPFSLVVVLLGVASVHLIRQEGTTAQAAAERAIALSREHGFRALEAQATIYRGRALAEQENLTEGIEQIRQAIADFRSTGAQVFYSYSLALLAEAYAQAGQFENGLAVLTEALTTVEKTDERFYEAELLRLYGELTLQKSGVRRPASEVNAGLKSKVQSPKSEIKTSAAASGQRLEFQNTDPRPPAPGPQAEAEVYFRKAHDIARQQHAKSLELRAAMSLARLWQTQGKQDEGRELLQEVYDWFTEGFETKDLQEAVALLVTLGGTSEGPRSKVQNPKSEEAEELRLEAQGLPSSSSYSLQPIAYSLSSPSRPVVQSFPQSPTPDLRPLTPTIVGREAELAYLHDHWAKARDGVRQAVFLSGEPGIGKTALVEAFLAGFRNWELGSGFRSFPSSSLNPKSQIPEPFPWIAHGQCVEQYGAGEAYLPILEALGRLGREPDKEDVVTILARYAPTWLAQLPALVPMEKREELQRILTSATRVRMLRELAEALEVLSARRMLILVLEDLHWSDPSTVELLAYLLRRQGLAHLFIIGTYRPADIITTDHPLKRTVQELQGRGHCEVLQLELLPEAAVVTYLHQRFGETPKEFARALHQRTDGNPLFLVATVEHLMREGIVVPDGARWRITQDLPTLQMEVPENLRQLIATQLDGLRPEEQQLLEVASVVGAEFTVAILAAELNQPREMLEAQCANLASRRQFLRSAGSEQLANGAMSGRYGFVHALYQRVIYEQIAEARRRQLHCRIGECKEQFAGTQARELASELATHFETGGDYPRAVRYLALAGETAMRRQAHHEAIRHLSKGLALHRTLAVTPDHSQTELSLSLALGIPLIVTQGWAAPQVGQVYSRAYELCQQIGTPVQLYSVVRGLELFHMTRTEYAKAGELAEQLFSLAQQMQNPALLVGAHMAVGQVRFFTGELRPALEHFEHGIARTPQHYDYQSWAGGHPGISSFGYGAWTLWFLGYPDQALQMNQEALRLAREEAHPFTLALCLQFAAKLHQVRREARATQSLAEENITLSMTHGFTPFVAMETHTRGWALAAQGHHEEGLAQMRHIQDAWRAVGMNFGRTYFLATLAETCGAMGQIEEGLRAVSEALALVEQTGERQSEAELYRLAGELLLRRGDGATGRRGGEEKIAHSSIRPFVHSSSEDLFRKAIEIARRQQAKSLELRAAMSLARLRQSLGKQDEARDLLQEIYDWFTEGFDTKDLQEAVALLQELGGSTERVDAKELTNGRTGERENGRQEDNAFIAQSPSRLVAQSFPQSPTPDPRPLAPSVFRSEGDYWTLVFHSTTTRVRDTRGMHYLAQLLRHPEREFSALALAADGPDLDVNPLAAAGLMGESRDPAAATVHVAGFTDAGEVLDPQAKAEYRQRLKEIEAELEEAGEFNDVGRIEKLQDELEFVTQELMGAVGLRGRARKSASPRERARVNVTRAIRTAITRVTEVHPVLGQYLTHTIKTGTFCSYVPEPHNPMSWEF